MKTINYVFAGLLVLFAFGACSPSVHVEKDNAVNFNNYKTYMWVDTKYSENDNTKRPGTYGDITVRNAANTELNKIGWKEVASDPDLLISYDILVENTTARKSDPVYTQSYSRMYYNPRSGRWSTIYYPSQFLGYNNYDVPLKEGTVSITLTDANTDKIVWQGWTTEEVNYSRISEEQLSTSVRSIFNKLDLASR